MNETEEDHDFSEVEEWLRQAIADWYDCEMIWRAVEEGS